MGDTGYKLNNHILTDAEKREICSWKYSGEYEIYNLPSYEIMQAKLIGFLNPAREQNYRAFYDGDCLVGFVNIKEEETEVFVGIGVKPELCSRGYDSAYCRRRILFQRNCIRTNRFIWK